MTSEAFVSDATARERRGSVRQSRDSATVYLSISLLSRLFLLTQDALTSTTPPLF